MTYYEEVEGLSHPADIVWRPGDCCEEAWVNGYMVAWMTKRPHYCDRGHYSVDCNLPGIDWADSFPRYFMSREVAISETEAFLKWRLWRMTP